MNLNPNILQTGSSGNCVVLNDVLALDMGVTIKKIAPYVQKLQLVFVSHEHTDHFKAGTVRALARERPALRFCGGPFLAKHFVQAGVKTEQLDVLNPGYWYDYGELSVSPVNLHHNVPNYGLKIRFGREKAIYIVDTGYIDDVQAPGYELYMVEANHGEQEIRKRIDAKHADGLYAYESEAAKNHLSREQAEKWLSDNAGPQSQYIFLHQHKERGNPKNAESYYRHGPSDP